MIEWIGIIIGIIGIIIGIYGILDSRNTRKEFDSYQKKTIKAISSMANQIPTEFTLDPQLKRGFQPESQLEPQPRAEKAKVIETNPIVKELIEYGIKEFGKKVIDDLLYGSEDEEEYEDEDEYDDE